MAKRILEFKINGERIDYVEETEEYESLKASITELKRGMAQQNKENEIMRKELAQLTIKVKEVDVLKDKVKELDVLKDQIKKFNSDSVPRHRKLTRNSSLTHSNHSPQN
eukprot:TRINITY_DN21641_c0_g1_i1.p1 TRINITY_DN21641_c0_g1~~TRINITY_DN21641_c0_g1_i1.p1  ORF type:complete len:109 (-),score=29.14 TRINITY_DN21641_c0_g1_i1:58-384(-)